MSVAAVFCGIWHLLGLLCVCTYTYTNAQKKVSVHRCAVRQTSQWGVLRLRHALCVQCPAPGSWAGQWRVYFQLKGTVTAGTLGLWILLLLLLCLLFLFSCKVVSSTCDPVYCSTPGFPVPPYLSEFAQVHAHWISDAIQPHPLSPPFAPAQHQGLF